MMENTNSLWKDTLEAIQVSVSPAIFKTWFSQTHLIEVLDTPNRAIAKIGCNSTYVKATIEMRYFGLIQDSLTKSLEKPCDIEFVVKDNSTNDEGKIHKTEAPLFERSEETNNQIINAIKNARLKPSYTFENFAVSSSNQMAWAAAEAVSKNPGTAYNPLFLWGGVGVGKTHLMSSVGHIMIKGNPDVKVYFCTGEDFTNDIVEGIRNKTTQNFRNKYRKLNLLMIDDIQFIAGKDAVQEEFFHTFNAVTAAGGQIILTSDRPPSEISKLEERLRSRFEAGLIVDIAPPDFELRCAILQIKTQERGLSIPMDLIQLIAGNIESARKIEGFLVKLTSEAIIKKTEITPELIASLLGKGEGASVTQIKAGPGEVVDAVAKYYSIGKRALLGDSRARPVARPRQVLMYLLRRELSLPLEEVGRLIGGRDHTTVMHAVDKIAQMASTDVHIREDILGIKKLL